MLFLPLGASAEEQSVSIPIAWFGVYDTSWAFAALIPGVLACFEGLAPEPKHTLALERWPPEFLDTKSKSFAPAEADSRRGECIAHQRVNSRFEQNEPLGGRENSFAESDQQPRGDLDGDAVCVTEDSRRHLLRSFLPSLVLFLRQVLWRFTQIGDGLQCSFAIGKTLRIFLRRAARLVEV
jgi:hypothetical protein